MLKRSDRPTAFDESATHTESYVRVTLERRGTIASTRSAPAEVPVLTRTCQRSQRLGTGRPDRNLDGSGVDAHAVRPRRPPRPCVAPAPPRGNGRRGSGCRRLSAPGRQGPRIRCSTHEPRLVHDSCRSSGQRRSRRTSRFGRCPAQVRAQTEGADGFDPGSRLRRRSRHCGDDAGRPISTVVPRSRPTPRPPESLRRSARRKSMPRSPSRRGSRRSRSAPRARSRRTSKPLPAPSRRALCPAAMRSRTSTDPPATANCPRNGCATSARKTTACVPMPRSPSRR